MIFKISLMGFTYHQLHSKTKWFQRWPILHDLCKTPLYRTIFEVYKIHMLRKIQLCLSVRLFHWLYKTAFIALSVHQKIHLIPIRNILTQSIFVCVSTNTSGLVEINPPFTISMSVIIVPVFCVLYIQCINANHIRLWIWLFGSVMSFFHEVLMNSDKPEVIILGPSHFRNTFF